MFQLLHFKANFLFNSINRLRKEGIGIYLQSERNKKLTKSYGKSTAARS